MVLLDEVVEWSEDEVHCRRTIREGAHFVENGRMPATVGLEFMAQSIAAYAGCLGHLDGEPVKLAFLLSCRNLELFTGSFEVGDVLDIFAIPVFIGDSALGSFDCRVERDGQRVAAAQLNVYQGSLDSVMQRVS